MMTTTAPSRTAYRPISAPTDGDFVGSYRLERRIGNGGTGSVWEAKGRDGERVAIKIVAPEVLEVQPELTERMAREWEACRRIRSERVVEVVDYGSQDGLPYLAMELVDGETLYQRVKREPLSLEQASVIVTQVAEALSAAHAAGVVHRDIKPGNIMLTERGVKVLDFGFAKLAQETASLLTQEGMSLGSPTYMSPEQYLGSSQVDARTDLWALSVVAYFTLTGQSPFSGLSFIEVARSIINHRFDPVSDRRDDLGPEVDAFFARAFAGPIVSRFQSAEELAEGFWRAASPSSSPDVPITSHIRRIDDDLRRELVEAEPPRRLAALIEGLSKPQLVALACALSVVLALTAATAIAILLIAVA